jgi:cell division ATPase FtsA
LHLGISEQQAGAFVTVITFGLAISGQRNVTRQTINKALKPALRMTFEPNLGLIQSKPQLFDLNRLG